MNIASGVLIAAVCGWGIALAGCSGPAGSGAGSPPTSANVRQGLSAEKAAELAARLANDQCERHYRRRPFRADQYPAVLDGGIYHWGGLDVGGLAGFSALVTFHPDGSDPHVEVYFSTDVLMPR